VLPPTVVCKTIPKGREVKARGALPSAPTSFKRAVISAVEEFPYKERVGSSNLSPPTRFLIKILCY